MPRFSFSSNTQSWIVAVYLLFSCLTSSALICERALLPTHQSGLSLAETRSRFEGIVSLRKNVFAPAMSTTKDTYQLLQQLGVSAQFNPKPGPLNRSNQVYLAKNSKQNKIINKIIRNYYFIFRKIIKQNKIINKIK